MADYSDNKKATGLDTGTPNDSSVFVFANSAGKMFKVLRSALGLITGIGVKKMTVGTTAPTNPTVGDVWVDTN